MPTSPKITPHREDPFLTDYVPRTFEQAILSPTTSVVQSILDSITEKAEEKRQKDAEEKRQQDTLMPIAQCVVSLADLSNIATSGSDSEEGEETEASTRQKTHQAWGFPPCPHNSVRKSKDSAFSEPPPPYGFKTPSHKPEDVYPIDGKEE